MIDALMRARTFMPRLALAGALVAAVGAAPADDRAGRLNLLHLVPVARFSVAEAERSGPPPHTVAFRNESTVGVPPATYAWTFGDGTRSSELNPTHTYNAAGAYTVTLTVRTVVGPDTSKHKDLITVGTDTDGDGTPDSRDLDDDDDGLEDILDPWPIDRSRTIAAGRFHPYREFAARCENPRSRVNLDGNPWPDRPGSALLEKHWQRSWSNDLYLWYDQIADVEPLSYGDSHDDLLEYFQVLRTTAVTPSGRPRDRFHSTLDTDEWQALTRGGAIAGYGATFALLAASPPREARVVYTEPNSPATEAGLARGAEVLEIDRVDFVNAATEDEVKKLTAGLYPSTVGETHEFVVRDLGATAPRTIMLRSAEVVPDPVRHVDVIPTSSGPVGYMLFNDHVGSAERELRDAVASLEDRGLTDFVLDLRYNGGGYLAIASQLAYMIAGPSAAQGRVFESLRFNDKHRTRNPVTGQRLEPVPFYTETIGLPAANRVPAGDPLPTLNLPRLFVLTGGNTCSASETIINSLRGIDVEVIQIGATTCGKPYGFYPFDNCGITYFTVQFQGENAKGFGDYPDGFSPAGLPSIEGVELPGCPVGDDYRHGFGDVEEARLRAALAYRETGTCPADPAGASSRAAPSGADGQAAPALRDGVVPKSLWHTNRWLHSR